MTRQLLTTLGLAQGTTASPPLSFTSGTNLTTPAGGAVEYDGTVATLTPNTSLGRAVIATPVYTLGASPSITGVGNTNIPLFPAANDTITLPIGTYLVDAIFSVAVSGSTVLAQLGLSMRGNGTAVGTVAETVVASAVSGSSGFLGRSSSHSIAIIGAATPNTSSTTRTYLMQVQGFMRITTAGTIIPSVQFSATLSGGTVSYSSDNYMIITPLASSSTANFTGAFG